MFMIRSTVIAVTIVVWACTGSDAPKIPLSAKNAPPAPANESPASGLTGDAKIALDSANLLFRAHSYDMALAQYRRSAELAPNEITPLLGILMVADITKNSALANETMPRLRKLDPSMSDSASISSHSKAVKAHPKGIPAPTT